VALLCSSGGCLPSSSCCIPAAPHSPTMDPSAPPQGLPQCLHPSNRAPTPPAQPRTSTSSTRVAATPPPPSTSVAAPSAASSYPSYNGRWTEMATISSPRSPPPATHELPLRTATVVALPCTTDLRLLTSTPKWQTTSPTSLNMVPCCRATPTNHSIAAGAPASLPNPHFVLCARLVF
jgi:hypothetical protein